MVDGTVVLKKQVHRLLFATAREFGALAPGQKVENDGVSVFC